MKGQVLSSKAPVHRMCQTLFTVFASWDAGLHTDGGLSTAPVYTMCQMLFKVFTSWEAALPR